jgi:hypothetical protein
MRAARFVSKRLWPPTGVQNHTAPGWPTENTTFMKFHKISWNFHGHESAHESA